MRVYVDGARKHQGALWADSGVATALARAILVAHGQGLASAFHAAMMVGAATASKASARAFLWLAPTQAEKT